MTEPSGPSGAARHDGVGRPAYLIVLRQILVAYDISLTISDLDPQAPVLVAQGVAEALSVLDGVGRLAVAFVAEAPARFAGSDLAEAVASRGGRVVLMGEDAEAHGEAAGFAVLARPFSSGTVAALLAPSPSGPA